MQRTGCISFYQTHFPSSSIISAYYCTHSYKCTEDNLRAVDGVGRGKKRSRQQGFTEAVPPPALPTPRPSLKSCALFGAGDPHQPFHTALACAPGTEGFPLTSALVSHLVMLHAFPSSSSTYTWNKGSLFSDMDRYKRKSTSFHLRVSLLLPQ